MIIHRAFVREVLQTCAAVTAILFSIFLVTRLVGFLSQAAQGDIPINSVFLLLTLKMLGYLDIIVPLVIYISILLVMGRWIRDNELTVISACGIGMKQFIRPIMILFVIVGTMVAAFSLYISPLAAEVFRSIQHEYRNRSDGAGIIPGVFTETRGATGVYFVETYDRATDTFQEIFVYSLGDQEDSVVLAASGYKTVDRGTNDNSSNDDFLVLKNGSKYRGRAGSPQYAVVNFETYAVRLKQRAAGAPALPAKAKPTLKLLGDRNKTAIGELHWRISKIIMLPILMLFALSFSSIAYRKNRFPGMLAALLVYFAYSNVLGLVVALIRRGLVNPHFSLWIVHLAFLCLAVYFFRRRCDNLRLIPGLPW
ncbi:LPS export ABC transporter permease LptF [Candidatus Spongiihabitans sp.]|uniref:LPS export ABC transporter permease LptF n=1 Tax=Candidatus Spongiihabitans sp. TaxID=3101308 RepID=UPI003C6F54A8